MKKINRFWIISLGLAVIAMPLFVYAQKTVPTPGPLLKRSVTRTEKGNFGPGGTITIVGAPNGSVTVEGWSKNEVEVTVELELQAPTEAELALLAKVNGIVFEPGPIHLSILTVGMHDKSYMKKNAKKFPKHLLGMPWKADYVVRVPEQSDLEVTVGKGGLKISGVEGAMQLKAAETDADLNFIGGAINATFGAGTVNVSVNGRSWRGRHLQIQMATGELKVALPADFNADVNASVLRTGGIQNSYTHLTEREPRKKFTDKLMEGRIGSGGAMLNFILGDGVMKLSELPAK